mmetsp:Transcript_143126/g.247712  ORF Transcript_143126/g.247712 Transcript_143126/m.247712 type:complete len:205 (+) Transcript_143126:50-664(+)
MDEEELVDVPYINSPMNAIQAALDLAEVSENDVLLDLGCGDGRVLVAAAERGARAVGVDMSSDRTAAAERLIQRHKVGEHCRVECCNFLSPSFILPEDVTVLYLFGTPGVNEQLRPLLQDALRRDVTYNFHLPLTGSDFDVRGTRRGRIQVTRWSPQATASAGCRSAATEVTSICAEAANSDALTVATGASSASPAIAGLNTMD